MKTLVGSPEPERRPRNAVAWSNGTTANTCGPWLLLDVKINR